MARRRRLRGIRASDLLTAKSEAKVRYGPERSAINALLGEAKSQYAADVQAAKAAGTSAVRAAKRAAPAVRKVYEQATSAADVNAQDVSRAFAQLGAAADPYEAITTREMGAQKTRIAEAAARAQQELRQRRVEAKVGRQYALGKARQDYAADAATLAQRLRDLGDEQGAYIVGRLGSLSSERAERQQATRLQRIKGRQELRQAEREHGFELEQIAAKGQQERAGASARGRGLGGAEPASRSEQRMFQIDFSKALGAASRGARRKVPRSAAARELVEGAKGVPSVDDQLAISMALDMAYDGHISRDNARELHERGLSVGDVTGTTSYSDWERRQQPSRPSRRRRPRGVGVFATPTPFG